MKYLGEKSLSSFLSKFFKVLYYLMLVGFSFFFIAFIIYQFFILPDKTIAENLSKGTCRDYWDMLNKDFCEGLKYMPVYLKFFVVPYVVAFGALLILIVKKMQMLFTNFKQSLVFTGDNVKLIKQISKYTIIFSIITFNINSLFIGMFLLILCEIFKNGASLQEEHDLTV